jgi:hypothetical protein
MVRLQASIIWHFRSVFIDRKISTTQIRIGIVDPSPITIYTISGYDSHTLPFVSTMKSNDTLPPLTSATTIRLQQERQRQRLALQNHMMMETPTTDATLSVAASANTTTNARMVPMKPIILSRKRRPESRGVDRKKLTELLNEALAISLHFDLESSNRNTSASTNESTVSDTTEKK